MLRLVVGGAAAVVAIAVAREHPRRAAAAPLPGEPADHVGVAVGQHRRQARILDARGDEKRPAVGHRVGADLDREPHALERGADLCRQILGEVGPALRDLALGADRDAPGEVGDECAVVEMAGGAAERGFA